MNLLAIETSTEFCSLALGRGGEVRSAHFNAGQRHAELILGSIERLLADAGLKLSDLDGIAYGMGPGAFTGLRIACGVTQGLALARGLPVVGVGTLEALAEEFASKQGGNGGIRKIIACLDARMGEVYHAAYRRSGPDSDPGAWETIS